jgi:hypothetical protein
MSIDHCPFDTLPASDAQELLDYLMWHQAGPQKRAVALANLRSLDQFGLAQLRAEMRYKARQVQSVGHADSYDPWKMD